MHIVALKPSNMFHYLFCTSSIMYISSPSKRKIKQSLYMRMTSADQVTMKSIFVFANDLAQIAFPWISIGMQSFV